MTALIMAGGRSERMRAGGSDQHKGLRTVLGVPLIEQNVRTLLHFGFTRIFVAVNARERGLCDWLERRGRALAPGLEVLVETEPRGTIGAVSALPRDVQDVVIVNVDNLTALDLAAMLRFHREQRAAATVATHEQQFPMPFGMLDVQGERVVAYREKPQLPVRISSGTYALSRRAIDRVPSQGRYDLPALIHALLGAGETVAAFAHDAPWIDVNDEGALKLAQELVSRSGRWPGAEP